MDEEFKRIQAELIALKEEFGRFKKRDERQQRFENLFRSCAALGAILAFFIGAYQYFENNRAEYVKTIWREQFSLYQSTCQHAAAIATAESIDSVKEDRRQFWILYYGPLSTLEDKRVKNAMMKYGGVLREVEAGKKLPAILKSDSYELAGACRQSLLDTWNPANLAFDLGTQK